MKKYSWIIVAAVLIVIIAIALIIHLKKSDYALKIDNTRVSVAELEVYLYEQKNRFEEIGGDDIWETDFDGTSAQEVAKQNAINSLVLVKTAVKQADILKISLNEEENKSIKQRGEEYYNKIKKESPNINITENEAEMIARDSLLQQKVFEFVTKGFEVSDADFEVYFDEYYSSNKNELNDVDISYIYKAVDNKTIQNNEAMEGLANEIYEKLLNGEDFSTIQKKYSDIKEGSVCNIRDINLPNEVEEVAYTLEEGGISEIIYTDGGFYILKAERVEKPDMKALKKDIREEYIEKKKEEIYQTQLTKWSENVEVEKNEEVCDSISIDSIK